MPVRQPGLQADEQRIERFLEPDSDVLSGAANPPRQRVDRKRRASAAPRAEAIGRPPVQPRRSRSRTTRHASTSIVMPCSRSAVSPSVKSERSSPRAPRRARRSRATAASWSASRPLASSSRRPISVLLPSSTEPAVMKRSMPRRQVMRGVIRSSLRFLRSSIDASEVWSSMRVAPRSVIVAPAVSAMIASSVRRRRPPGRCR